VIAPFGHEDISVNDKAIPESGFFQDSQEKVTALGDAQLGLTVVATAANKIQILGAIITIQPCGHLIRGTPTLLAYV
jgi:hypothetical protein